MREADVVLSSAIFHFGGLQFGRFVGRTSPEPTVSLRIRSKSSLEILVEPKSRISFS